MYPRTWNPSDLDTTLPARRFRLTPAQAAEVSYRLEVTAETPDLTDWGWIVRTGRTSAWLHVLEGRELEAVGFYPQEGTSGDLVCSADIAEDSRPQLAASLWRLVYTIREAVGA